MTPTKIKKTAAGIVTTAAIATGVTAPVLPDNSIPEGATPKAVVLEGISQKQHESTEEKKIKEDKRTFYANKLKQKSLDDEIKTNKKLTKDEREEMKSFAIDDAVTAGVFYYDESTGKSHVKKRSLLKAAQAAGTGEIQIEIISKSVITGGVEVYARAWDTTTNTPFGFSQDGTVEIEHFRFHNPPVLVPDPKGTVVRHSYDPINKSTSTVLYREDPAAALKILLGNAIKNVATSSKNLVPGKIGSTVDTFAPTVDGAVGSRNGTFTNVRNGINLNANTNSVNLAMYVGVGVYRTTTTNYNMDHPYLVFDTSSIGAGNTIDAVTLDMTAHIVIDSANDGYDYIVVTDATLDNNTTVATGDWDSGGYTEGSDQIELSTISYSTTNPTVYNTFTFNTTGEGWVNTTGKTEIGLKSGNDTQNVDPLAQSRAIFKSVDYTGTASDPVLTVTHSPVASDASPLNQVILFGEW